MVMNKTCRSESLCGNQDHTNPHGRREGSWQHIPFTEAVVFVRACPCNVPGFADREVQLSKHRVRGVKNIGGAEDFSF